MIGYILSIETIAEKILSHLDENSLLHCLLVSKTFSLVIGNIGIWKQLYEEKSKKNPHFHQSLFLQWKALSDNHQVISGAVLKRLIYDEQKIKNNWKSGKYWLTTRSIWSEILHLTAFNMDAKRVAFGFRNFDTPIVVYNRWTFQFECTLLEESFDSASYRVSVRDLQFYGDLLFCLHADGELVVWNLVIFKVVHKYAPIVSRGLVNPRKFHVAHNLLIISSHVISVRGKNSSKNSWIIDTSLSVHRIHNPGRILLERTEDLLKTNVRGIASDQMYFALFIKLNSVVKLQLRSIADFQIIRQLDIGFNPLFAFNDGRLVTLEGRGFFRLWDTETFACIKTWPNLTGGQIEEILLDSSHLIARGLTGQVSVWDLPTLEKSNNNPSFEFQLIGDDEYNKSLMKCDGLQILTVSPFEGSSSRPTLTVREFKE